MIESSPLKIGKHIHAIVKKILPTYPILAEKGAAFPFCVYRRTSIDVDRNKDVFGHETRINVELVIADSNYENGVNLAAQVYDALENKELHDTLPERDYQIKVVNATENWVNDAYIQTLQVQVTESKQLY